MGRVELCVFLQSGPDYSGSANLGRLPMNLLLQTLHLVFEAQL
jgi:hypothetical protein